VAVRLAVDELMGPEGVTAAAEAARSWPLLAELPDLWNVNVSDVDNDSLSARFSEEGYQTPYVALVKQLTSKPVVGVGRFTSPDTMVVRSARACSISSAPRGRRSPIPSCRADRRGSLGTRFANASVAHLPLGNNEGRADSAARRTRPWGRMAARLGIPNALRPREARPRSSSSAAAGRPEMPPCTRHARYAVGSPRPPPARGA